MEPSNWREIRHPSPPKRNQMTLQSQGIIRIISEPKTKEFDSGAKVLEFYGGIQEGRDKQGEWINNGISVQAWNKTGDLITEYLQEGDSFVGIGSIQQQDWEKDGQKRSKHVFKLSRVEFLPKPKDDAPTDACGLKPPAADACGIKAPADESVPF